MNIKTTILVALLAVFALIALNVSDVYAQKRMTFADYQNELKAYQEREANARQAIEEERGVITQLRAEIAELERQIAAIWDQIYAALGMTKDEYEAYIRRIDDVERRIKELEGLSPDALYARAKELDELSNTISAMMGEKPARLDAIHKRLVGLAGRVDRLKSSLPKPQHDMYSVIRGDYLWKISGKKDIYGDPWKWMRIYSSNRVEIKDPDLIYPGQKLRIPRQIGRDEHLVKRGESLQKIAGLPEVYGNPFQWTKIYQANKSGAFLSDPNVIYPEMILTIPR